ncbi:MAG: carboxylate--amine ligase [Candidatus Muirbacterium halophilum]|nr:carboxylate--amine ligase [Candidatus Muirbacterium halophilum]MCK9477392.1 carboxylate--amine ligase [Candidatus Muirbacterium halophilum]
MENKKLIYISPHYPHNFANFVIQAKQVGITVLGITDCDYNNLSPEVKHCLSGHYKVNSFHNTWEVFDAVKYFLSIHGNVDFVESNLESWLDLEAIIRVEFKIPGLTKKDLNKYIKKSEMKKVFDKNSISIVDGELVKDYKHALNFAKKHKFPVIIKPDRGVGAFDTYKILNADELCSFFKRREILPDFFFIEPFIEGNIETFDGICDFDGKIVYCSSLQYTGTLEMKNGKKSYILLKDIPKDLIEAGKKAVKGFDVRGKFFHIEFFRTKDNVLYGLEINLRPPGGFTTDMINFAGDIDIYREWANIIQYNKFFNTSERKYNMGFCAREDWITYKVSNHDLFAKYGENIIFSDRIPEAFAPLMGNQAYLIRAENLDDIYKIFDVICESV